MKHFPLHRHNYVLVDEFTKLGGNIRTYKCECDSEKQTIRFPNGKEKDLKNNDFWLLFGFLVSVMLLLWFF